MSKFIYNQINNKIKKSSKILILGLTFKENVPDLRNSKVFDLIKYFKTVNKQFFDSKGILLRCMKSDNCYLDSSIQRIE